jgi:hypothetical protein
MIYHKAYKNGVCMLKNSRGKSINKYTAVVKASTHKFLAIGHEKA